MEIGGHVLRIDASPATTALYATVLLATGFFMNTFGIVSRIARFGRWWQVLTCYGLYITPLALLIRHEPLFDQYLWGLLFIGVLELAGYSLGTSVYYPDNVLFKIFSERNFSLVMTLFFAGLFPAVNKALARWP